MNILECDATRIDRVLKNREIVSADVYATRRRIGDSFSKQVCSALTLTLKPLNDNEKPIHLTIIPSREYGLTFFAKSEN